MSLPNPTDARRLRSCPALGGHGVVSRAYGRTRVRGRSSAPRRAPSLGDHGSARTESLPPGRAWIAAQQLPVDERLTVNAGLRQLDFLGEELAQVDAIIAQQVLGDEDVRRLMTIPGIDIVTAATLVAVIGDVRRFPTSRHLVGYLGCTPRSANRSTGLPATAASPRKARPLSDTSSSKRLGRPPRAQGRYARSRNAPPPGVGATSRPLPSRASSPCSRGSCSRAARTTRFARPSLVHRKLRALERAAGAPRAKPGPKPDPVWNTTNEAAERRVAKQAEAAYRRFVADWQTSGPKVGAGATPERASNRPSEGKAAQATSS